MVVLTYQRPKGIFKGTDLLFSVLFILFSAIGFTGVAHANDLKLTDIFYSKSFQGSWEVATQWNWVGMVTQWLITSVCILGLASVCASRCVTLLYLSGRSTWDTVYEYKNDDKGSKFWGFESLVKKSYNGNRGVGLDAIVQFGLSLLPNVKAYSEYNPDRLQNNLSEEDSASSYMMKTAFSTIMLLFFFSMGFNGSMMRGYGTIVDAFGAVADKAVDYNLAGYVKKKLNTGESYDFTIGDSNFPSAKFADRIAQDIYGKVLARTDLIDTTSRLAIGLKVEQRVYKEVLGSANTEKAQRAALQKVIIASDISTKNKSLETDADVEALRYDIIVNTNKDKASGEIVVAMSEFLPSGTQANNLGSNLYVHIVIRKDKVSESDFFVRPTTSDKSSTGGNTTIK